MRLAGLTIALLAGCGPLQSYTERCGKEAYCIVGGEDFGLVSPRQLV